MQELYQFALAQGATPPFALCVSLPRTPLPLKDLQHKDIVELQIEGVLILVEEDLQECLEDFVNLCDAQVGCFTLRCSASLELIGSTKFLNFTSLPCSKQGGEEGEGREGRWMGGGRGRGRRKRGRTE